MEFIEQLLKNTTLLGFLVLFMLNLLDFVSGMMKAKKKENVTSRQMGDGFTKKAVQFLIGVALFLLMSVSKVNSDLEQYNAMFIVFFNGYMIGTITKELVSIKENLVSLGYLEDNSVVDSIIHLIESKTTKE